jgi:dsDNA-specific endonuclease/ATPase MutS2
MSGTLQMNQLEFEKVKQRIREFALSEPGRILIDQLSPITDDRRITMWLMEAEEACGILKSGGSVPIPSMEGLTTMLELLGKGYLLQAEDLALMGKFIESGLQMKRYMKSKEHLAPQVSSYALSLHEMKGLQMEIERCIRHGRVTDHASSELLKIRKQMAIVEERMRKKLDGIVSKYRSILQEAVVSMRNNRYVLPVKREHRKQIAGSVLDESASGQTVFVEPADIASLQLELREYSTDEAREEAKVLGMLTAMAEEHSQELSINYETFAAYDFLFAKAKYGYSLDARKVALNKNGLIYIKGGRHPLLGGSSVPLDFHIGRGYNALLITGPNTGGKTVSLKTVGLLTLMVQAGLLVPVEEGSEVAIYTKVVADIGDGQSIEQSLSTFSAHIRCLKQILDEADSHTLVLLDELAAGTDPGEGVGLSIAILEELQRRKCTVVATTHFNEIKRFAEQTAGFQNARMEFDQETLRPLYKLKIGEAGSSYAFDIAYKLGIDAAIIARSREIAKSNTQLSGSQEALAVQPPEKYFDGGNVGDVGEDISVLVDQVKVAPSKHTPIADAGNTSDARKSPNRTFTVGDCVWISSFRRTGIVCSLPDNRGRIQVMIQKEKVWLNVKRLSLYIEREKLYPEGEYDMDIVFDSKENRKKRNQMKRKHVEGMTIEYPDPRKSGR